MASSLVYRRRVAVLAAPAILAIPTFIHAQVFTAAPTGDYNNALNWNPNGTPGSGTAVQIRNATGTTATLIDGENGQSANLNIGNAASQSGTLSLTSSATFTASGVVTVGSATGAGTLINNGTFAMNGVGNNLVGNAAGSTGTLLMKGGSLSTTSALLAFGNLGAGTLIQSGGTITLTTGTFGLGRQGTGYYDLENGTLIVGGVFQMATGVANTPSGVGTLVQNGGTISSTIVTLGANGNATCTLNGGTILASQGMNLVNNSATTSTVFQGNNEFISTGTLAIGGGSSSYGSGASLTGVATYTLASGTISAGTYMLIGGTSGSTGIATFTQTGGFGNANTLTVGIGSTSIGSSAGTMNISGTGSVQVGGGTGLMQLGAGSPNSGGASGTVLLCATAAGTSSISAGTLQVGSVLNGSTATNNQFLMGSTTIAGALPTVTVGTLNFGLSNNVAATTRLFALNSGTLTAGLVDLTSYNAQDGLNTNQATFQQLGGTLNATSMTFGGGIYQVGNGTVAPSITYKGGISVIPAGTIALAAGIGNGSSTYSGGGTITVNGLLTSNGSLTNNGGTLNIGAGPSATYAGGGTVTFRGAETNAVGSNVKVWSGQLNLQADAGANTGLYVSDHATIGGGTFANAIENLGTLSVLGGGVVRLNSTTPGAMPNILLHTGTLSIKGDAIPTGTLDVAANDVIVDNGNLGIIRSQVISGRSAGTWTGPGIRSSAAAAKPTIAGVGYANVSDIGTTTFDGVDLSAEPGAVLVKYTLLGDANLDGIVNTLDFNALASNYGNVSGSANWVQGDYTYDGTVNSSDFDALAANFGGNVAALGADLPDAAQPLASLGTVVPEPVSFSMIALAGVGMMQRRRRA